MPKRRFRGCGTETHLNLFDVSPVYDRRRDRSRLLLDAIKNSAARLEAEAHEISRRSAEALRTRPQAAAAVPGEAGFGSGAEVPRTNARGERTFNVSDSGDSRLLRQHLGRLKFPDRNPEQTDGGGGSGNSPAETARKSPDGVGRARQDAGTVMAGPGPARQEAGMTSAGPGPVRQDAATIMVGPGPARQAAGMSSVGPGHVRQEAATVMVGADPARRETCTAMGKATSGRQEAFTAAGGTGSASKDAFMAPGSPESTDPHAGDAHLSRLPEDFRAWDRLDNRGVPLAHVAARNGYLPSGFDRWEIVNAKGQTVAETALRKGTLPDGFDRWELPSPNAPTLAHLAAEKGLLPPGFDRWEISARNGWTVAHAAAFAGNLPSDFERTDLADASGRTVGEMASKKRGAVPARPGQGELAKVLIPLQFSKARDGTLPEGFKNWESRNGDGLTLAHAAAEEGTLPLDFGNWTLEDASGRTVLQAAAEFVKSLPLGMNEVKTKLWYGDKVLRLAKVTGYVFGKD
ncbi:MAG: hypothetical protein LBT40_03520 [Deltaproteobacteria bacterium]|nr:hypothetical protein [Deltaproteobacteria bacterium]